MGAAERRLREDDGCARERSSERIPICDDDDDVTVSVVCLFLLRALFYRSRMDMERGQAFRQGHAGIIARIGRSNERTEWIDGTTEEREAGRMRVEAIGGWEEEEEEPIHPVIHRPMLKFHPVGIVRLFIGKWSAKEYGDGKEADL